MFLRCRSTHLNGSRLINQPGAQLNSLNTNATSSLFSFYSAMKCNILREIKYGQINWSISQYSHSKLIVTNLPSLFQFRLVMARSSWMSRCPSCPSISGYSTSRIVSRTLLYLRKIGFTAEQGAYFKIMLLFRH